MQKKKLILVAAALVALIAVFLGIWYFTRPETQAGSKTITVTVVHQDGTEKTFTCHTDEEYLDKVLLAEQIVQGEEGPYGLFIQTADGETAEGEGWWMVCIGTESATAGVSEIPVTDGGSYSLVYTVGWQ